MAAIALCGVCAGCASPQRGESVTSISVENTFMQQAIQTAEDVLRCYYFDIDKSDLAAGYILTRPQPGADWFEFWRKDNVGPTQMTMANIHSLRRTAEINITPTGQRIRIDCTVYVQRLHLPAQPISGFAQMPGMFTKSSGQLQKLRTRRDIESQAQWIDLQNDGLLGAEILDKIQKKLDTL